MDDIEQTNKVKILEELQKNGRASISEIAEKIGLSRQTVAKIIDTMEKNKEIWGYTAIFDPKLIGKNLFIFLIKADLSINPDDLVNKIKSPRETKYKKELNEFEFHTTCLTHGPFDFIISIFAKDIIEAKKIMNALKKIYAANIKDIQILDVIITFRNNGITRSNIIDEWIKLII